MVYGDDMLAAVVPNSAKPFNFQREYSLTEDMVSFLLTAKKKKKCMSTSVNFEVRGRFALQALRISDHYPVEVELCEATPFWMEKIPQRRDNVDTQNASVNSAVTGTEYRRISLCPATDR